MALLVVLLCLFSTSFAFQLLPINNPFTGTWPTNTYEYFDSGLPALLQNPVSLWGGTGTAALADPTKLFYALVNEGAYNGVCSLAPRFGTHVFVTLAKVSFSWNQNLYAFGGYFGANHNGNGPNGNDVMFEFYDVNNVLLATTTTSITNNCTWFWRSWGFDTPIVRKVVITGPEEGGLVVTDQIRVSDTDVYIPGGTSGTTGTTGTTGFPGGIPDCPNRTNSISFENKGTQYRVDNEIGEEVLEGRWDLRTTDIFQAWFTRTSFPSPTASAKTRFKQRLRSIVEFLDIGGGVENGYIPKSGDTLIKETDVSGLAATFQNWVDDNGHTFVGILPSTGPPIFTFHGKINPDTSACAGFPLIPNVASMTLDIDWTSRYTKQNSKIALRVRYTLFEDITNTTTGVDTETIYNGDQRQLLYNEFMPEGQPTTVDSELGAIQVFFYDSSVGSPDQPEYEAYYSFDAVDHTLHFTNFRMVSIKPPA